MRSIRVRLMRYWHLATQRWMRYRAWQEFERANGKEAAAAMRAGFVKAEQYHTWNHWSLDHPTILWAAHLISQGHVQSVVEFGAGYSTIVLSEFLRRYAPHVRMESFEHQPEFAARLREHLPPDSPTILHCVDLVQVADDVFNSLFHVQDAYEHFIKNASLVAKEHYHETRLRNTFYKFDFRQLEHNSVDLIILDGPNGNGRSLAFPLMREAMNLPSWILIDDYTHYPFLDDLWRVFSGKILRCILNKSKQYALIEIQARS